MRQRVCLSDPVRVQAQFQLESACFRAERILVFQTGKDLLRIMQPPFVQSAPHICSQCRNDQPGHPLSLSCTEPGSGETIVATGAKLAQSRRKAVAGLAILSRVAAIKSCIAVPRLRVSKLEPLGDKGRKNA